MTLGRGVLFGILAGAVLFLFAGLAISVSRSSYLYAGFAVGILTLSRRETRLPALAALGGLVGFVALLSPTILTYAMRPGSGVSFRDSLWVAGWKILNEHPWTGLGLGANIFESTRAGYVSTAAHRGLLTTTSGQAHNVFLTKGAELGWLGLLLTLVLFVMVAKRIPAAIRAYRQGDWLMGAAAAGFVGLTVRAMFESGVTLGAGHLSDSLIFFFFIILLLGPQRVSSGESMTPFSARTSR
jgi:O-antigen ligase